MYKPRIIITSPSLDTNKNIGGISTVTSFLINNNFNYRYEHFELGKLDEEKRGIAWFFRILKAWGKWGFLMIKEKDFLIHFNFALDKRSIIRDSRAITTQRLMPTVIRSSVRSDSSILRFGLESTAYTVL